METRSLSDSTIASVKNVIVVISGKGGVGKSTVAVELAVELCARGFRVGLLDVDLCGPSVPRMLGLSNAAVHQCSEGWVPVYTGVLARSKLEVVGDAVPEQANSANAGAADSSTRHRLAVMSIGFLLQEQDTAVIWRGPKKNAMIRQFLTDVFWPSDLDYLVIDTPPGTSDEHISLVEQLAALANAKPAQPSQPSQQVPPASSTGDAVPNAPDTPPSPPTGDAGHTTAPSTPSTAPRTTGAGARVRVGAVVVSSPQLVSVADVRRELSFCTRVRLPVFGLVENLSGFACPHCAHCTAIFARDGARGLAHSAGIPFLGALPIDPALADALDAGAAFEALSNVPSAAQLRQVVDKLLEIVQSS